MIHAHIFMGVAHAAELAPVAPPTDWLGVILVASICFVIVAAVGYIVHIKRTPGAQWGEEEIERLAELLHRKQQPAPVVIAEPPMTYDGITFADQSKLDEYKAAKAIVDSHKGGTA